MFLKMMKRIFCFHKYFCTAYDVKTICECSKCGKVEVRSLADVRR